MANIRRHKTEAVTHPPNTFSTYAILALVVGAFLILVFVARAQIRAQNAERIFTLNQKQHSIYQNILGEMRTGVRLARWQDFTQTAPESRYKQAARLHISVLKAHEQTAWARYSEHVYRVRVNADKTANARDQYTQNWGTLQRTRQLSLKENEDSSKNLTFETAKSIYAQSIEAKGDNSHVLIGEAKTQKPKPKTYQRPPPKQNPSSSNSVQEARMKTARTPKYPRSAKRRGVSGEVILSLNIDDRGRVVVTKLVSVKAKRYRGDFVRAAKRAARRSRFYPKMVDGVPVNTSNYKRTYIFAAGE